MTLQGLFQSHLQGICFNKALQKVICFANMEETFSDTCHIPIAETRRHMLSIQVASTINELDMKHETTRYMKQHAKSQFLRATIVTLFNFLLATSRLPPPSLNFTSVLTISNFCEVSPISRIFSLSTQYAANDSSLFEQSKNILPEIHANTQCSALVN